MKTNKSKILYKSFVYVDMGKVWHCHCVKGACTRSFSGPHSPAFGLNIERYSVSLRIQSECAKKQTRQTPNTYMFAPLKFTGSFKIFKLPHKLFHWRSKRRNSYCPIKEGVHIPVVKPEFFLHICLLCIF